MIIYEIFTNFAKKTRQKRKKRLAPLRRANLASGFLFGDQGEDQDDHRADQKQRDDDAQEAAPALVGAAGGITGGVVAHIAHGRGVGVLRSVDDAVTALGGTGGVAQIAVGGVEHIAGGAGITHIAGAVHAAGVTHVAALASVHAAVFAGVAHKTGVTHAVRHALPVAGSGGEEILHGSWAVIIPQHVPLLRW